MQRLRLSIPDIDSTDCPLYLPNEAEIESSLSAIYSAYKKTVPAIPPLIQAFSNWMNGDRAIV